MSEYSRGRTPIPCVRCNSFTKFRDLLAHADALDCRYIATGHYAVARDGGLYRGRDRDKDQSYFLWGIDRAVVARMLTPVGALTKRETRALRAALRLTTADKPESVEICFVPDGDYAGVLERHLPRGRAGAGAGAAGHHAGEVIGEHDGYARYTIGQRKGLPGGFAAARFVVAIHPERREVVIGSADELAGHRVAAGGAQLAGRRRSSRARLRGADPPPRARRAGDGAERRRREHLARAGNAGPGDHAGPVGCAVWRAKVACSAAA